MTHHPEPHSASGPKAARVSKATSDKRWGSPRRRQGESAEARTVDTGSERPEASERKKGRDRPWLMRTYAGHSTAEASNALYRSNLAKGQTGLSVAFDLPTQTGYDPDHELALGEVGRVGVPVSHLGDCSRTSRWSA